MEQLDDWEQALMAKDTGPELPGDSGDTTPTNILGAQSNEKPRRVLAGPRRTADQFSEPVGDTEIALRETVVKDYLSNFQSRLTELLDLGEDTDLIVRLAMKLRSFIIGADELGTTRVARSEYGYIEHLDRWLAAPLVQLKVVSVGVDIVVCHSFDDDVEGAEALNVDLPFKLRKTPFDGNTVAGITYSYNTNIEREATDGTDTITEEIIPRYTVGDIIYVCRVAGNSGIGLLDINADARAWSKTGDV